VPLKEVHFLSVMIQMAFLHHFQKGRVAGCGAVRQQGAQKANPRGECAVDANPSVASWKSFISLASSAVTESDQI